MWGATPFDQLYCRIKFRQSRWEGQYTPITEKPTLMYPAWYGGTNWGGATIDETRGLLILPDIRFVHRMQLLPKDRSEEHTSELQSLMRISYAVFCLKKKNTKTDKNYQMITKNKRRKREKNRE